LNLELKVMQGEDWKLIVWAFSLQCI